MNLESKKGFHPLTKLILIVAVFAATAFALWSLGVFGDTTIGVSLNLGSSSLEDGLVAHYTFDGTDLVSNVVDSSDNGNTAYLSGFTSTTTVSGTTGQALEFDGTDDNIFVGSSGLIGNGNYSFSVWFKTESTATQAFYESFVDNSGIIFAINRQCNFTSSAGYMYFFGEESSPIAGCFDISVGATIYDGNWHMATYVRTGDTTAEIFLDGASVGTGTVESGSHLKSVTTRIGSSGGANSLFMNGSLDDIRIYNRALSASEVKQLYNLGATTKFATTLKQGSSSLDDGLVGHWTFDGPDLFSNAADRSGEGNHGYLTNMTGTTTMEGAIGQAIDLDGVDDYVLVANESDFDFVGALTLSVWVRSDGFDDASEGILTKGDGAWRLERDGSSDDVVFNTVGLTDNSTVTGIAIDGDETWHHIAVTYDGATKRMYQDGALASSEASTGSITTSNDLVAIGNNSAATAREFNGAIDDVRMYNRALSADEITRLYRLGATTKIGTTINQQTSSLQSGLVGHWTFDGPDLLQNVTDRSGEGNTGYLSGFTSTTTVEGAIGQALRFDGSNDRININNSSAFNLTGTSVTVSAWINGDDFTAEEHIFRKDRTHYNLIVQSNDTPRWEIRTTGGITSVAGSALTPGQWYHLVGVYDGSRMYIYINGSESNSAAKTGNLENSGTPTNVTIGVWDAIPGSTYWNGLIDDVRVYDRALSADEVKQLYNLGR